MHHIHSKHIWRMDPKTQFIDMIENDDFIRDTSNIRKILFNGSKLLNDGCIKKQRYYKIMIELNLGEVTTFITKWGIKMVPINIHVAVNDVEKIKLII